MNSPRISVIVPVYNVLPWIDRCVHSLVEQDYENLEIILVDDGSADGSGDRCEALAKEDGRIRVIHQKNAGLSAARNAGIRMSEGSWLVFVDSDDSVSASYVSDLWGLVNRNHADLGVTGFIPVKEGEPLPSGRAGSGRAAGTSSVLPVRVLSSEEAICNMWYQKGIPNFASGKIFPREWFGEGEILFPEGRIYEDLAVMYLLFSRAERIVWSDLPDYYYTVRKNSIMTSSYSPKKMDRVRVGEEILEWSRTKSPALRAAGEERFFLCNVQFLREMPLSPEHQAEAGEVWDNIKKYRGSVLHNPAVKRSNRLIALASYLGLRPLKWLGSLYTKIKT